MVSEVVMYQSMFVLGILVFGFFSVSFNQYNQYAEEVTLETNMENVVQEVGQQIVEFVDSARSYKASSSDITSSLYLVLDAEYAGFSYLLSFETNVNTGQIELIAVASDNNDINARVNLGYINGTSPGEINFSGTLASGDTTPTITYTYTNTPTELETLFFS